MKLRVLSIAAPLATATLLPSPALAQTASPAAQRSAETADLRDSTGEDIIVTAQRREERLSRVPSSIAAFSQERLDVTGARDFVDIANFTPGVRIRDQQNQIAVRGLASNAGAATTGVYIDEIPIMARTFGEGATSALPYLFDLDRVEVLRGPQGVLFGAGSLGGTVRYITPTPSTTETRVYGRGEVAATQDGDISYEAGVGIGVPIIRDVAGARVSAAYARRGGWVNRVSYVDGRVLQDDANWRENIVLRGSLNLMPASGLTIQPSIMYQRRNNGDTDSFYPYYSDVPKGRYNQAGSLPLSDDDKFTLTGLTARYDAGGVSIISTSSLFSRNQQRFYDGTLYELTGYEDFVGQLVTPAGPNAALLGFNFLVTGQIDNRQRNFTQEVRIQSNNTAAPIQWLLGAFYSNNRQRNIETYLEPQFDQFLQALYGPDAGVLAFYGTPLLPNGASYIGNQNQRERQLAFFGNLTVKPVERLTLQAGLRWSEVRFDYNVLSTGPYIAAGRDFTSGDTRERPVTPRVNASYQANPNLMVYATASKGYRTGGLNGPVGVVCQGLLAAAGRPVPPRGFGSDSAWNYEIGSKGTAAGIRFDASAFHIDWKNIQQRVTLDPCSVTYTLNLGQAKSTGFDLALTVQPVRHLSIDLAVGYVDTRYTRNVYLTNTATSGPLRIAAGNGIAFAGTPWQLAGAIRYDFDEPHDPFVRLEADYASKYDRRFPSQDPATISYSPLTAAGDDFLNVKARIGMTFGNVQAQAFVDNLLYDRTYYDQFRLGALSQFRVQRPRTIGLTMIYRQ